MTVIKDIYKRDLQLLLWCVKSQGYKRFMALVRITSRSGDGYLQLLLPCIIYLLDHKNGASFFILTLMAFSIERILYFVLKNTLKRRRPPQVLPHFYSFVQPSDQFSFPSGHTMAAFLLAGLSSFYFGAIALPFYLWACSVGASRVILGVHFPTDIIAGAALGTLIAIGINIYL